MEITVAYIASAVAIGCLISVLAADLREIRTAEAESEVKHDKQAAQSCRPALRHSTALF